MLVQDCVTCWGSTVCMLVLCIVMVLYSYKTKDGLHDLCHVTKYHMSWHKSPWKMMHIVTSLVL